MTKACLVFKEEVLESTYFIPILLLFFVIYVTRQNNMAVINKLIKKGKSEDKAEMIELAKRFIGKECIIYTFNSQVLGIIKEVSEGAVLVEGASGCELINFDFIVRIREYPRNKNGKKKSLVID